MKNHLFGIIFWEKGEHLGTARTKREIGEIRGLLCAGNFLPKCRHGPTAAELGSMSPTSRLPLPYTRVGPSFSLCLFSLCNISLAQKNKILP